MSGGPFGERHRQLEPERLEACRQGCGVLAVAFVAPREPFGQRGPQALVQPVQGVDGHCVVVHALLIQ